MAGGQVMMLADSHTLLILCVRQVEETKESLDGKVLSYSCQHLRR